MRTSFQINIKSVIHKNEYFITEKYWHQIIKTNNRPCL